MVRRVAFFGAVLIRSNGVVLAIVSRDVGLGLLTGNVILGLLSHVQVHGHVVSLRGFAWLDRMRRRLMGWL